MEIKPESCCFVWNLYNSFGYHQNLTVVIMKRLFVIIILLASAIFNGIEAGAQKFIHPGIDQTEQDLDYMKSLVLKGEQPWSGAFERMKERVDLNYKVIPYEHVMRGPYGRPNIGGDDLSKSSDMAYDCALIWYITGNRDYASKAIEILNLWSPVLRDFDYNDAKLLAGWTGHKLCNAAEILKYSDSGWRTKNIEQFKEMLMTVYYPLLRFYYPQANGNWDGAIIHSLLAIGVFTDNHEIFDNAVSHFLYGPENGSLFKYIFPSGQCQESTRDQAHVQLGLIEFAGAARIAYTQGIDLFSVGNNRLALGYEYTVGFILGQKPQCYGGISERAKDLRSDYESVYLHYKSKGVEMPFTKKAADSVRVKASRSILTALRVPEGNPFTKSSPPEPGKTANPAGASVPSGLRVPANIITVAPGQSIQSALDSLAGTGGCVIAEAGLHTLPSTLRIPSGVTLAGEGVKTILLLYPSNEGRDAIVNKVNDLHDVTIRDLIIECGLKAYPGPDPNSIRSFRNTYNRGGIIFRSSGGKMMNNINLNNISVRNGTFNGIFISGASRVSILCCNFSQNGAGVVPGPGLQHNLLLTHCTDVTVRDSRIVTSPNGSGIAIDNCKGVVIDANEIARNGFYGLLISESVKVEIKNNFIEGNDRAGIMTEFLKNGSEKITIYDNTIQYNNGFGIESYGTIDFKALNNRCIGNNSPDDQMKISSNKTVILN